MVDLPLRRLQNHCPSRTAVWSCKPLSGSYPVWQCPRLALKNSHCSASSSWAGCHRCLVIPCLITLPHSSRKSFRCPEHIRHQDVGCVCAPSEHRQWVSLSTGNTWVSHLAIMVSKCVPEHTCRQRSRRVSGRCCAATNHLLSSREKHDPMSAKKRCRPIISCTEPKHVSTAKAAIGKAECIRPQAVAEPCRSTLGWTDPGDDTTQFPRVQHRTWYMHAATTLCSGCHSFGVLLIRIRCTLFLAVPVDPNDYHGSVVVHFHSRAFGRLHP